MSKYKTIGQFEEETDWLVTDIEGNGFDGFTLLLMYKDEESQDMISSETFTGKTFSECEQNLLKWANNE
jgi:hypothetical protein